jgi:hypothetical protein
MLLVLGLLPLRTINFRIHSCRLKAFNTPYHDTPFGLLAQAGGIRIVSIRLGDDRTP